MNDKKLLQQAIKEWNEWVAAGDAQPEQEPVQPSTQLELQEAFARGMACRPASMQPEQATLSDSEILNLWHRTPFAEDADVEQVLFARLLLARYGIGETK